MKDITLRITGKQKYEMGEEDQMEFVTDGKLFIRNESAYIIYDESEVSGMEGCKTTIRLKGQSVRLKRIGDAGIRSELYFEIGRRISGTYKTPYGSMGIEVLTDSVNNAFDMEKGEGSIDVEYQVSVDGLAEGRNRITIEVS